MVVAWNDIEKRRICASIYDAKNNSWSMPVNLCKEGNYKRLSLVMNDKGDAIAAWAAEDSVMVSHFNLETKNWSEPLAFRDSGKICGPSISIDEKGHAVIIWANSETRCVQSMSYHAMQYSWSDPVILANETAEGFFFDEACEYFSSPIIALNKEGVGMAIWVVSKGKYDTVQGVCYDSESQALENPIDFSSKIPANDLDRGGDQGKLRLSPSANVCVSEEGIATIVWDEEGSIVRDIRYVEYDIGAKARLSWKYSNYLGPGFMSKVATNRYGDTVFSHSFIK